jgi:tight adherence protein B
VGMPIVTATAISIMNPKYLNVLFTDELGRQMLTGVVVAMLIGIVWIRRVIRIEV